jgi:hypothetical protein
MLSFKQRYTALIQSGDYASQEELFNCRSLLFVKVGRSKVNVYAISFGTLESKPVVSLYEKHMVLHYWPVDGSLYWKIPSFMKVRFKSIYTDRFVTFCNGTKSIFFPGMKVTQKKFCRSIGKRKMPCSGSTITGKKRRNGSGRHQNMVRQGVMGFAN